MNLKILPILGTLLLCGCDLGVSTTPRKSATGAPQGTVALVNGVALSGEDLEARLKADAHLKEVTDEVRARGLQSLINEELAAQRAVEKGYEGDASYQAELAKLERQLAAFKRKELARLYFQKGQEEIANPSDSELAAYFEEHRTVLQTEVRVSQILRRDRAAIEADAAALAGGKPFEEVATGGVAVPHGMTPWDLGFLNWAQLPEAWRDAVATLKEGEPSAPIEGERGRYWILKVTARRENPDLKLEDIKGPLANVLRANERQALRNKLERELRDGAKIAVVQQSLAAK